MHDERRQLMQGDALFPAGLERVRFVVGTETRLVVPAEESHHCKIEFSVSAVASGVDQPADAARADKAVSCPEVSM